jgi:predicted MFS family arabinose efflux permease
MPVASTETRQGWVVVAAAFAITFVGFGCAYSFSAFIAPLEAEFGGSRAAIAFVFSLAGFLYFALGAISGPLADRWGARPFAIAGMALLGMGLVLAGFARSLSEVCLAYGLGVGGGVGLAYVPVLAAVQRWFAARRALASGLAVSGIGVGTLVIAPLAAWLIGIFGWRGTFWILGVVAALAGISMALLVKDAPYNAATMASDRDARLAHMVRTSKFLRLYLTCLACGLASFIPFVHLVPFALDRGMDAAGASALIAVIGAGSTAGRFLLGSVADRLGRDRFLAATYIGLALTMGLWALASDSTMLVIFSLLYGVIYGGWVAVLPSVVADRFGTARLSGVMGLLYTSVAIGTLVGPVAAGMLYDATGSYRLAIVAGLATNVAAAAIAVWDSSKTSSR